MERGCRCANTRASSPRNAAPPAQGDHTRQAPTLDISRMRAAGIAADVVAAWHGHTERMTQAVYGRVIDNGLTAASAVFWQPYDRTRTSGTHRALPPRTTPAQAYTRLPADSITSASAAPTPAPKSSSWSPPPPSPSWPHRATNSSPATSDPDRNYWRNQQNGTCCGVSKTRWPRCSVSKASPSAAKALLVNRSVRLPNSMPPATHSRGLAPGTASPTRPSPPRFGGKASSCGRAQDGVKPRCSMAPRFRSALPQRSAVRRVSRGV